MLKALIVDDEELARRGLEIRLQKFDDVEVSGECRNGREAIDAVREKSPDIVFLDVQMPGIDADARDRRFRSTAEVIGQQHADRNLRHCVR
jgi:two-component system LytT family response regulator